MSCQSCKGDGAIAGATPSSNEHHRSHHHAKHRHHHHHHHHHHRRRKEADEERTRPAPRDSGGDKPARPLASQRAAVAASAPPKPTAIAPAATQPTALKQPPPAPAAAAAALPLPPPPPPVFDPQSLLGSRFYEDGDDDYEYEYSYSGHGTDESAKNAGGGGGGVLGAAGGETKTEGGVGHHRHHHHDGEAAAGCCPRCGRRDCCGDCCCERCGRRECRGDCRDAGPPICLVSRDNLVTVAPVLEARRASARAVRIVGMQPDERVMAVARRPTNRAVYVLGSTPEAVSRLYILDPFTGYVVLVGAGPLPIEYEQTAGVGMSFNPVTGLLRVVSTDRQNVAIDPDTAAVDVETTIDVDKDIFAAAHTNSRIGATQTALYTLGAPELTAPVVDLQYAPESGGEQALVGALDGISLLSYDGGLDMLPSNSSAYALLHVGTSSSTLYRLGLPGVRLRAIVTFPTVYVGFCFL